GLAGKSYEDRFVEMMKYHGADVAHAFVINETLAPWISYYLFPLSVELPLVNQPTPEQMKDLTKEMGSAENVRKEMEKSGLGWHLPGNEEEALWVTSNHDLTLDQIDFLYLIVFGFAESPDMIELLERNGLIPKKSEVDNTYAKLLALIRQNKCVP
ncbi:MAG: hypothetical protein HY877_07570, partial [Deltaproteobacteria bacterium]|nr:hypothetical protein [Deltaproteobacteria bacterium]